MRAVPAAEEAVDDVIAPHVDFDLHGIVGLRLLDPRAQDVDTITRQIGPLTAPLTGDPDITVRLVDRLPDPGRLTYAGWPDSAAAGDDFFVLRGRDGVAARTLLPVDAVGGRCDIVCERRAGAVPHLLAVINLTALAKGVLPLHASAFTYRGAGVLATGWAKGGKTETLLAFAARGAHYVGDEWVYLTPDGNMYGVPEPIRLWHWHVAQLPALRATLPWSTRARLGALPSIASSTTALAGALAGLPASVLRRTAPVLRRQAYVQVPPARLFGADAIALRGRLDHIVLVVSHDRDDVSIEPVPGTQVAARMLASLEDERSPFLQLYRQFRFLFPDRRAAVVEEAPAIERRLLEQTLSDRPAHLLRHPYPVHIESLVEPVEQMLRAAR
ncbi:hypothetical protein FHU33_4567 [Blastococcus colisei]|uniref:Hpr(Ser) kinase/phosphatase n=1 Tax=Blastococcus colisei TaxID=1564162 RepID=A0A543P197_9ACTN|nr:hypothetical protein [Blastococcus colisei]TQN37894.1 hypothetical protein FHU33_4567 [Blastococcus colisei]